MAPKIPRNLTDPSYISEEMFDRVVSEKFQDNQNDDAVRNQAIKLIGMIRASKRRSQIIADILHASRTSSKESAQDIAEIGFSMGVQFGFELGLTYPPLR
jgi:hypothetical protein